MDLADSLLTRISKQVRDPKLLREARGQFVTSLVTAFEVYFREMLRKAIDDGRIDVQKIPELQKRNIPISDLEWIKKKRVSVGEIICLGHNFQNLDNIERVFSAVIGEDFISAIRKHVFNIPEIGEWRVSKDFYQRVEELLRLRHTFVHEVNFKTKFRAREISDMLGALVEFVYFADEVLEEHLGAS